MTRSKHDTIYELTTSPKKDKLTIKNISPEFSVCVEEDLRPGMHPHGGAGYVTDCIGKNDLITLTVTYYKLSSSGGWLESNITYRRLTGL